MPTLFQAFFDADQIIFGAMSPVGNCGRKYSPRRTVTLQRLAISTVLEGWGCRQTARTSPLRCAYIAAANNYAGVGIVESKAADRDAIS